MAFKGGLFLCSSKEKKRSKSAVYSDGIVGVHSHESASYTNQSVHACSAVCGVAGVSVAVGRKEEANGG